VQRTAMCGRAAPMVACGEGEVGEAHNAPRFLEQERGGPRGHRSRRINKEFPRWHRSSWWGQLENAVVSVGLNGEGVARGHRGGHPPQSGSSAGRLVRCGDRSARACVSGYGGEENNVCAWLKRVQNQTTRGAPLWAMPRGGRGSTGPGIQAAARERRRRTPLGRRLALCGRGSALCTSA
jgi:hypothetical protein